MNYSVVILTSLLVISLSIGIESRRKGSNCKPSKGGQEPKSNNSTNKKPQGKNSHGGAASTYTSVEVGARLAQLFGKGGSDYIISPLNLDLAITLLWLGVTLDTRCSKDVRGFLYNKSGGDLYREIQTLNAYKRYKIEDGVKLDLVNRLFKTAGSSLNANYKKYTGDYNVKVEDINFGKPDEAREHINRIVSQDTNGLIPQIVSSDSLTSETKLISVNTLYFKGIWDEPYDENLTDVYPFNTEEGKIVQLYSMTGTFKLRVNSFEPLNAQVIMKSYKRKQFSFVVVLPNKGQTLKNVEKVLFADPFLLYKAMAKGVVVEDSIQIPKINFDYSADMLQVLRGSKLDCLFDAGLDNFLQSGNTVLDAMLHKVRFESNEKGSEGAAATATNIVNKFGGEATYEINRPFLYFVIDNTSKNVLFWGRYANPTTNV